MRTTFADLGIPFPLFEAPISEARHYAGLATCSLCERHTTHCFELRIGSDVIVSCSACDTANVLRVTDHVGRPCRVCQHPIAFPNLAGQPPLACYSCLREGRVAFTQDTALGMVRWIDAIQGITHGRPRLHRPNVELVPRDNGWVGARIAVAHLLDLVRTPPYSTIQGEEWQFHCGQPMVYIGPWTPQDFQRHSPTGDGRAYFDEIVADGHWLPDALWKDTSDQWGTYVFRCGTCVRLAAHWGVS